jgi:hypothetical protein
MIEDENINRHIDGATYINKSIVNSNLDDIIIL